MNTEVEVDDLPMSQYLILDVLAARFRAGDWLWTFPIRCRPALRKLAERGLVELKTGVVEKTIQARLTDKGRGAVLLDGYRPVFDQALDEVDVLLREWMDWWAANDDVPAKMPNALHVRTGMYLSSRSGK